MAPLVITLTVMYVLAFLVWPPTRRIEHGYFLTGLLLIDLTLWMTSRS